MDSSSTSKQALAKKSELKRRRERPLQASKTAAEKNNG